MVDQKFKAPVQDCCKETISQLKKQITYLTSWQESGFSDVSKAKVDEVEKQLHKEEMGFKKIQGNFLTCIFTQNFTLPQVFFKHFGNKNQLPGLSKIGTLLENGIKIRNLKCKLLNHHRLLNMSSNRITHSKSLSVDDLIAVEHLSLFGSIAFQIAFCLSQLCISIVLMA